ncbi:copper resistance protein CopC [Bacillus sp. AK128]
MKPKPLLLLFLLFIIQITTVHETMAHSTLVDTYPNNFETVDDSPTSVEVTFRDPVVVHSNSIQILRSNNEPIQISDTRLDEDDKHIVATLGEDLTDGSYTVNINVIALDGDIITESFQFTVKQEQKVDQPLEVTQQFPMDGQILNTSTDYIELQFNQPAELTAIGLFNSEKEDIRLNQIIVDPNNLSIMKIPIHEPLKKGTYQVTWYAKPQDSTSYLSEEVDVFYFAVEEYTPITRDVLSVMGDDRSWLKEISLKQMAYFFIFLSMMSLFGGTLLTAKVDSGQHKRWNKVIYSLSLLLVVGIVLLLFSQKQELQQIGWIEFFSIKFVWIPLLQLLIVLLGVLMKRYRIILFGIGLLLTPFYIGHATYPQYGGFLTVSVSLLHVFTASIWLGGILALLIPSSSNFEAWIKLAGPQFSKWAMVCLPTTIITGIWMTFIFVPSFNFASLWSSDWGKGILLKSLITMFVFLLGFIQRKALLQLVGKGTRIFRGRLLFEAIYILLLLIFVSNVVVSAPSAAERAIYPIHQEQDSPELSVEVDPLKKGLNELTLKFDNTLIKNVDITFVMPPDYEATYRAFRINDQTFKITGNIIHTAGITDLIIKAYQGDDTVFNYSYQLVVPGEISE